MYSVSENDRFITEIKTVFSAPGHVISPEPTDSRIDANEEVAIRKGGMVRLQPVTQKISGEAASALKTMLDMRARVTCEVEASLILKEASGSRRYLDTIPIKGVIEPLVFSP